MILRIDHLGIAVNDLELRRAFWEEALGLAMGGRESVPSEGVEVVFLPAGESRIELLEPTRPDSAIARHLDKRGEGIHHVTFAVSELDDLLARLVLRGIEVVGGDARTGAGGRRVAFLHPRSTGGVLVELVEDEAAARRVEDPFAPGRAVLAYLGDPPEKLWGLVRRLDASGVVLEGIDLGSFDDWIGQVERGEEGIGGPSVLFLPMRRIERLLLDRPSGELPSLSDRFLRRVGRSVQDVLGA